MGLGIGTIAEVAKQSLGGKQKEGVHLLFSLSSAPLFFHPFLKYASAPFQLSPGLQLFTFGTTLLSCTCVYIQSAFFGTTAHLISVCFSRHECSVRLSSPVRGQRGENSQHPVQSPRSRSQNRADAQYSRYVLKKRHHCKMSPGTVTVRGTLRSLL